MNIKESLDVIKRHWNTAPVPVSDIADEIGTPILYAVLPDEISGMIRRDGDGYMIVVNKYHALTRKRFTIAHEIGHYIYHRDLLGAGTGDTRAYRAIGTDFPNPKITAQHERQANTFAANLLMPNHLIKELRASGIRSPDSLAAALQVSPQAMRIKLGLDGRVPSDEAHDEGEAEWAPPTFRR